MALRDGKTFCFLLVEDNLGDAQLVREALREDGSHIRLFVVRDGVEAIAFLDRAAPYDGYPRPDLILMDLNLPKMDGRELLVRIKTDARFKRIPVVVLTTSEAEKDVFRSYDLGANCYISKPVHFDQFVRVMHSLKEFWFTVAKLPAD